MTFILVLIFWTSDGRKEVTKEFTTLEECTTAFLKEIDRDQNHISGGNLMVEFSGCEVKE